MAHRSGLNRSAGSGNPILAAGKRASPNRTIGDSPVTEGQSRKADLHDPLRAPGQLPGYANRKSGVDPDEAYGSTQIPREQVVIPAPTIGRTAVHRKAGLRSASKGGGK